MNRSLTLVAFANAPTNLVEAAGAVGKQMIEGHGFSLQDKALLRAEVDDMVATFERGAMVLGLAGAGVGVLQGAMRAAKATTRALRSLKGTGRRAYKALGGKLSAVAKGARGKLGKLGGRRGASSSAVKRSSGVPQFEGAGEAATSGGGKAEGREQRETGATE